MEEGKDLIPLFKKNYSLKQSWLGFFPYVRDFKAIFCRLFSFNMHMHVEIFFYFFPSFLVVNLSYFKGVWFFKRQKLTNRVLLKIRALCSPDWVSIMQSNLSQPLVFLTPPDECHNVPPGQVLSESFRSLAIIWTTKRVRASLRSHDWTLLLFPDRLCSSVDAL